MPPFGAAGVSPTDRQSPSVLDGHRRLTIEIAYNFKVSTASHPDPASPHLTDEQKRTLYREDYVILPGIVPPELVAAARHRIETAAEGIAQPPLHSALPLPAPRP